MTRAQKNIKPRIVVIGLASCFGCQLQITNIEQHLLDVLGQIDLRYWQLTSSVPMPDSYDVAIIEGAPTTEEAVRNLREVRKKASCVITVGACAATGGIPALAADVEDAAQLVYGQNLPVAAGNMLTPRPVSQVISVDYAVRCCPINPMDLLAVLQRVLRGSNRYQIDSTLCGECKLNERGCFFGRGSLCLGLVTRSGCGARCPGLNRPCNGCAGLSPSANLDSARDACKRAGVLSSRFDAALEMFNRAGMKSCVDE